MVCRTGRQEKAECKLDCIDISRINTWVSFQFYRYMYQPYIIISQFSLTRLLQMHLHLQCSHFLSHYCMLCRLYRYVCAFLYISKPLTPDVTYAVDLALKTSYLSIQPPPTSKTVVPSYNIISPPSPPPLKKKIGGGEGRELIKHNLTAEATADINSYNPIINSRAGDIQPLTSLANRTYQLILLSICCTHTNTHTHARTHARTHTYISTYAHAHRRQKEKSHGM